MTKQNQNPSNVRGDTDREREERKTTREEAGQKSSEKMRKEREHMSDVGKKGGEAPHRDLGKSKEEKRR